jgi:hypothetical protein
VEGHPECIKRCVSKSYSLLTVDVIMEVLRGVLAGTPPSSPDFRPELKRRMEDFTARPRVYADLVTLGSRKGRSRVCFERRDPRTTVVTRLPDRVGRSCDQLRERLRHKADADARHKAVVRPLREQTEALREAAMCTLRVTPTKGYEVFLQPSECEAGRTTQLAVKYKRRVQLPRLSVAKADIVVGGMLERHLATNPGDSTDMDRLRELVEAAVGEFVVQNTQEKEDAAVRRRR